MKLQTTIKTEAKISGRGLFGGEESKVVFRPAEVDTGIVFVRTDIDGAVSIPVDINNVAERSRRSSLKKGSVSVETVEHCLASISALGIDNLTIEISGSEMPCTDGSALEYFRVLKRAGIVEQQAERKEFVINKPVTITDGDASIYALPYGDDTLTITYDLDYSGHTGIRRQIFSCRLDEESFEKNLAPARTFVLEAEAKQLQARGIGKHITPRDILVIDSDGPIKNSFKFEDECVRHKIVDLIGDLMLVGRSVKGRIVAYKSGHSLNQKLTRRLYEMSRQQERTDAHGTDALLDIRKIQKILPHRYPFLMVDRIVEIDGDRKITGIKNVTFNEPFFQGHYPGTPIMPGVMIVEAMAQVSGLLFSQMLEHTGKIPFLVSMEEVKLRKAVVPGDQLMISAETVRVRSRTGLCKCKAMVGDNLAAEAQLKFMLVDDENV